MNDHRLNAAQSPHRIQEDRPPISAARADVLPQVSPHRPALCGTIRLLVIACCLALLPPVAAEASDSRHASTRSFGGTPTDPGVAPWAVRVEVTLGDGNFAVCSGAILNPLTVVTAAHCAAPETGHGETYEPSKITVLAGVVDLRGDRTSGQLRLVRDIRVHPDWVAGVFGNDVALLTVNEPWSFTPAVQPIEVSPTPAVAGLPVALYGFGVSGTSESTVRLQTAPMTLSEPFTCSDALLAVPSLLCARSATTKGCGGDSGGPLVVMRGAQPLLVAVDSFAPNGCSAPGVSGVTDLTQPSTRAFLAGSPVVAPPRANTGPRLVGEMVTGRPITCITGTRWSGAPTTRHLAVVDYTTGEPLDRGPATSGRPAPLTAVVAPKRVGDQMLCVEIATNDGGTTQAAGLSQALEGTTAALLKPVGARTDRKTNSLSATVDPVLTGTHAHLRVVAAGVRSYDRILVLEGGQLVLALPKRFRHLRHVRAYVTLPEIRVDRLRYVRATRAFHVTP